MKHAGADALRQLEKLLTAVRKFDLIEVKPGILYRKRSALLYLHEGPERWAIARDYP